MLDRRAFLAGAATLAAAGCARPAPEPAPADPALAARLEAIRSTLGPGGRLGLAAVETGSDRWIRHDSGGLYAMASTFKLPLAAAVLAERDRGALDLDEELAFDPGEPLPNSPTVEAARESGRLPIRRLCGAIVERSDNSAANLLLRRIGGPAAVTRFVRRCGDPVTRLDRYETELNSNLPGDPRDTTSPAAMAELTRALMLGDVISADSRRLLSGWLRRSVPGLDRLMAGLPVGWLLGHKTGTGANGAHNDVGIAYRSGRPPVVIASYLSGGDAAEPVRAAAHAAVARLVAATFA